MTLLIKKAPENICKLFTFISDVHTYNNRLSSINKLYTQPSLTNNQRNSFSRMGVRLWNKIPFSLTNVPKRVFKREIRRLLFSSLENKGQYVEISELIDNFP